MRDDVAIALEEFRGLRAEIFQRSGAQQILIQLNLTGVAAVVGVFLTPFLDGRILFLIPLICPSLGLLWLDHAKAIDRQGTYIRDFINPFLSEKIATRLPCYEDFVRRPGRDRRGMYNVSLSVAIFVLFFALPLIALTAPFGIPSLSGLSRQLFWLAAPGAGMLLIFGIDYSGWMALQTARPSPIKDRHA